MEISLWLRTRNCTVETVIISHGQKIGKRLKPKQQAVLALNLESISMLSKIPILSLE
jgi:hypothetical protein